MAEEIKNNVQEMDWDSGIPAEVGNGEPYFPAEGEYPFKVLDFEKTFSRAGNKMAKLSIEIYDDGHTYKVTDYIVLNQPWKCAQFFESLGFKKKGSPLPRMPWEEVTGATGSLILKHEDYNDKTYCKVSEYTIKEAEAEPEADTGDELPFDF